MVQKWQIEDSREVLKGGIFRYRQNTCRSLDSGNSGKFDILEFSNWVNVIPITLDNKVVMVEQYRFGTDEITLEIPGGAVSPGEELQVAATRELNEETGYAGKEWVKLGSLDANPAFMTNSVTTFLVKGCEKVSEQNLDPLEEVDIRLIDLKDIPSLINEGKINHSLIVAAFALAKFQNQI